MTKIKVLVYKIACYHYTAGAIEQVNYGGGSGLILFDYVRCSGQERRLVDCPNHGIFFNLNSNCNHNRDAGVVCVPGKH